MVLERDGWTVYGVERSIGDSAGGVLALVREGGKVVVTQHETPFDGYVWLLCGLGDCTFWLG